MAIAKADQGELAGIAQPFELRREEFGSSAVVVVSDYRGRVVASYEVADAGLRNLAIVGLSQAGWQGKELARVFGVRPEHVSRLRRMAGEGGAAGLVPVRGRPVKMTRRLEERAYAMADQGMTGVQIAAKLKLSEATVSRHLSKRPRSIAQAFDLDVSGEDACDRGDEEPAASDEGRSSNEPARDTGRGDQDPGGGEDEAGGAAPGSDEGRSSNEAARDTGRGDQDPGGREDEAGGVAPGSDEGRSSQEPARDTGRGDQDPGGREDEAGGAAPGSDEGRSSNEAARDTGRGDQDPGSGEGEAGGAAPGSERSSTTAIDKIASGERESAYAGAMLLHGFIDRAGAAAVLSSLPSGTARRYDAASLMLSATMGFALGVSSAEGTKHLLGSDAGALVGLCSFPHLRTLRPRLNALAEAIDPLATQVALSKAMLSADEHPPELFFAGVHFVAYAGAQPVGKGWNTRRRVAEPGRDDTFIVDELWRAVCFTSGAPSGLSRTMWDPLDQLSEICGNREVMVGFDRGGAYPKVFAELNKRGIDWITYRRAPLVVPAVEASWSWVETDNQRRYLRVADEIVTLKEVGEVRQISVIEHDVVVVQILTSNRTVPAARLALRLRHRWCIENTFKYLEDHQGIHWLCDYDMDLATDTTLVANPARKLARKALGDAQGAVAALEQAIGATATEKSTDLPATNARLDQLAAALEVARADQASAKGALKDVPAQVPANQIDPSALRATPRTSHRHLQMVCRLLAYNAELDLARALDAYLDDQNEYRAITRNLLHQPGTISYSAEEIVVTIRRPDAPRIAGALERLCRQLTAGHHHLTGDRRPITYRVGSKN